MLTVYRINYDKNPKVLAIEFIYIDLKSCLITLPVFLLPILSIIVRNIFYYKSLMSKNIDINKGFSFYHHMIKFDERLVVFLIVSSFTLSTVIAVMLNLPTIAKTALSNILGITLFYLSVKMVDSIFDRSLIVVEITSNVVTTFCRSIEYYNVDNYYAKCLYNVLTSKVLFKICEKIAYKDLKILNEEGLKMLKHLQNMLKNIKMQIDDKENYVNVLKLFHELNCTG